LLTPDEIAYTIDQEKIPDSDRKKEYRARPNVIFEFGYFVSKLGRNRVCALHKGNVAIPSDLSGFIYKKVDTNVEEIGFALIKELKTAGLKIEI
jgi:predicted nucleotide-binding protein